MLLARGILMIERKEDLGFLIRMLGVCKKELVGLATVG